MSEKQERFGDDIFFYLKDEDYGWMSNFYPSEFKINGIKYKTVEHYYQSMKSSDPKIQEWIRNAPKPYLAMRAGRNLRDKDGFNKEEWENKKIEVMHTGIIAKFRQNLDLWEKLKATGDRKIHEASPSDKFWGFTGGDYLGKTLEMVRHETRFSPHDPLDRD